MLSRYGETAGNQCGSWCGGWSPRRHVRTIAGWGTFIGLALAVAMVLAPRWGKGWFALLLGIVLAVMMVCYVAVPARIVGIPTTKPAGTAHSGRIAKLAGAAVTGLFGAIVCTPPYAIARGGIYLLGNHFAAGWRCSSSA